MFGNDYTEMARSRRNDHEAYIEEQRIVRSLVTRRSLSLSTTLMLLLLALFAFLFASGCIPTAAAAAPPTDPNAITADMLVGTYRVYDTGYPSMVAFAADGTFSRAVSPGKLIEAPVDWGTWHIEGETLVLTSADDVSNCGKGRIGRYDLSRYESGGLMFQRTMEACEARIGFVPTPASQPLQPAGVLCDMSSTELCADK